MSFWKMSVAGDKSIVEVLLDGGVACSIQLSELPCEKTFDALLSDSGSELTFREPGGRMSRHLLSSEKGWGHFSVRVAENLSCQADCVVSDAKEFDPAAFGRGEVCGIRFQPFFLNGASVDAAAFRGQGLFVRGLHFGGTISPGNLSLACSCDECGQSFRLQSFHAGLSQVGYFYSRSGRYTLLVASHVPGSPVPLLRPLSPEEALAVAELERGLPLAPDGTSYNYSNPLRCPHCNAPYIDFEAHPELRPSEYYGNTLFGEAPLVFETGG